MNTRRIVAFKFLKHFLMAALTFNFSTSSQASEQTRMKKSLVFNKDLMGANAFDYAKAMASHPSKQLQFLIEDAIEIESNRILLTGWLVNKSSKVIEAIAFPVSGHFPFSAEIKMTPELKWKSGSSTIPPAPPPPMSIKIPGKSRVQFVYGIDISDLVYKGSPKVELEWHFNFWNEPRPSGIIKVNLPAR